MSKPKYVLDKSKRFSYIRGTSERKYQQDGRYFDHYGEYVGDNPDRKKARPAPVVEKPRELSAEEKRQAALASAADKLGGSGVPQTLQDAAKENAEALAAEDNAA